MHICFLSFMNPLSTEEALSVVRIVFLPKSTTPCFRSSRERNGKRCEYPSACAKLIRRTPGVWNSRATVTASGASTRNPASACPFSSASTYKGRCIGTMRRGFRRHAARGQKLRRELLRTAAFRTDQDALALQLRQSVERFGPAIENPDRLIGDPSHRASGPAHPCCVANAALQKPDVDAGFRIGEQFQILGRGGCLPDLERDAVLRKIALILLREPVIRRALAGRRDDDFLGRRGGTNCAVTRNAAPIVTNATPIEIQNFR